MLLIKLLLISTFLYILIQDAKDRLVYTFLFPIVLICCSYLHYQVVSNDQFFISLFTNLSFEIILLLSAGFYSKYKLKQPLKYTFGMGDLFFFIAISSAFASISFIILFVFALIISLLIHLVLNRKQMQKTVPLAGYMSLFFAISYLSHWLGFIPSLYNL